MGHVQDQPEGLESSLPPYALSNKLLYNFQLMQGMLWLVVWPVLAERCPMSKVTSREVIHNFSAIAARVAAGEELTVTRYGKPLLKLSPATTALNTPEQREELVRKALSFRMTRPLDKSFERMDAYPD
jgi:antitoxin (DNA-binding transcriptional repressor) of toxin-antitoxin stability system